MISFSFKADLLGYYYYKKKLIYMINIFVVKLYQMKSMFYKPQTEQKRNNTIWNLQFCSVSKLQKKVNPKEICFQLSIADKFPCEKTLWKTLNFFLVREQKGNS